MQKEKYTSTTVYSEVSVEESKIVSFNKYDKTVRSFRVYEDGFVGIHYQQGEMSDKEGYEKAQKNLELKRPYPFELIGGAKEIDKTEKILSDADLMKKARRELAWLNRTYPDFTYNGNVFSQKCMQAQENSAGMNYVSTDGYNGIGFSFKHKDSKDISDGYFSINMRTYSSTKFRRMADNYLANYTKIVELPEDLIIMMPDWEFSGQLIGELNAEKLALGTSLLTGKVGQKVFADGLTVCHNVAKKNLWMDTFWDAEGFVPKSGQVCYIRNGKILRGYADRRIAAKYKAEYTGSAYQNYNDIPQNGWIKTRITPVQKTPKQMLEELGGKLAVVPVQYSGGGFKEKGDYAMPVQMGYLTDGEKILGRVPLFTMRSNLFDIFGKDFLGVSKYSPLWNASMMLVRMEKGKL